MDTITLEHIINGSRAGRTVWDHRRRPCLAPSMDTAGWVRSKSSKATASMFFIGSGIEWSYNTI